MNEGQIERAVPQTAIGTSGRQPSQTQGNTEQLLDRLQKNNARLDELIHFQRDRIITLTGNNPVQQNPEQDRPQAEGVHYQLLNALETYEKLLEQLNQVSDAWSQI